MSLTRVQLEKQNKDLRIRLENHQGKAEIAQLAMEDELVKLRAKTSEYERVIAMLQHELEVVGNLLEYEKSERIAAQAALREYEERITAQQNVIEIMTARLNKDSSNSGKPPSSDGLKKQIRNNRIHSDKKPGGQEGHAGHGICSPQKLLELVSSGAADFTVVEHGTPDGTPRIKYEFDILVRTVVTEHRFYAGETIPAHLQNPVNYGSRVKAICVDLTMNGLVSAERTAQFISSITDGNMTISKASVLAYNADLSDLLTEEIEVIRECVITAKVLHVDETVSYSTERPEEITDDGVIMETAKGTSLSICLRAYSCVTATLLTVNPRKGDEGVLLDNILTLFLNILVHDHDIKYYKYLAAFHAECNEHILRYLLGLIDLTKHKWEVKMRMLLIEMLAHKYSDIEKEIYTMDADMLQQYSQRYDEILALGFTELAALIPDSYAYNEERKMLTRLREYKSEHLLFAFDYSAPFSNNAAEQSLRWSKTKLKVSGCYRSYHGAEISARIMSFIQTLRKREINVFGSMLSIFNHNPVLASH